MNQEKIGKTFKVLFDKVEGDYFIGRTEFDSPEVDNEVLVKLDNPDSFKIIKDADGNDVMLFDDIEYYDSKNLPKTKNPSEVKVLDGR